MSEQDLRESPSNDEPEPFIQSQLIWRRLLPFLLTVLIFGVIFWRIPFDQFLAALSKANYLPFLALMLPFSLYYFLMDTLVLTTVMRWFHGAISYRNLLPVRAVTYLVSVVNTQLAQGAMALYLSRRLQVPFLEITSSVLFLIVVEVTQLMVCASLGMLLFPAQIPGGLFWVPLIWGMGAGSFLFCIRHGWIPFLGYFPSLQHKGTVREWALFRTLGQATFTHYLLALLLKAPIFLVSLFVHWFALQTFDIHIPLLRLLAFLPIVFLVAALPVTVAHLGTAQAAWIFFFGHYASESALLAYSITAHLTFMLANGSLGCFFLPTAYRDLFGAKRRE